MKDNIKKPMPKTAVPSFVIQPRAHVNVGGPKQPALTNEVKKPSK